MNTSLQNTTLACGRYCLLKITRVSSCKSRHGGSTAYPDVWTESKPTVMSFMLILPLEKGAATVNMGTFRPDPMVTSAIGEDTNSARRPSGGTVTCTHNHGHIQSKSITVAHNVACKHACMGEHLASLYGAAVRTDD